MCVCAHLCVCFVCVYENMQEKGRGCCKSDKVQLAFVCVYVCVYILITRLKAGIESCFVCIYAGHGVVYIMWCIEHCIYHCHISCPPYIMSSIYHCISCPPYIMCCLTRQLHMHVCERVTCMSRRALHRGFSKVDMLVCTHAHMLLWCAAHATYT